MTALLDLPVEGWASSQISYRHLIRPVVAFVRDGGPVCIERVARLIIDQAYGNDAAYASPSHDPSDGALRIVNLLVDDLDVIIRHGDELAVAADTRHAISSRFGSFEVPDRVTLATNAATARRERLLRDWVRLRLFDTVWRNGIRERSDTELEWMVDRINTLGYIGPRIVVDQNGVIIDGHLRDAALRVLDMDVDEHCETVVFANDLHRLAYVIAAHATPGRGVDVGAPLRDAILAAIRPRGVEVAWTLEDLLAIHGRDFPVEPMPIEEVAPVLVEEPVQLEREPVGGIVTHLLDTYTNGPAFTYHEAYTTIAAAGLTASPEGVNRRVREMRDAGLLVDAGRRGRLALFHVQAEFARPRPDSPPYATTSGGQCQPGRIITASSSYGRALRQLLDADGPLQRGQVASLGKSDHVLRCCRWVRMDGASYLIIPDREGEGFTTLSARMLSREEDWVLDEALDEGGRAGWPLHEAWWKLAQEG